MRGWAALLLAGCGGEEGAPPVQEPATDCEGSGEPELALGEGGRSDFLAWRDGDPVEIEADGGGRYGFSAELSTSGLDTTAPVTAFLRFSIGDDPTTTDAGASLTLQCPSEGPGWYGLFVPLGDDLQDPDAVSALGGLPLRLSATVTDRAGEVGAAELELAIAR